MGAAIVTMQVHSNEEGPRATLKPGPRNKARHSTHTSQPKEKKRVQDAELKCSPWLAGRWEQLPGEAGQGD